MAALLKQISVASSAEVVFKSMCFELHGLENEARAAVNMIMELDVIKVCLPFRSPKTRLNLFIDFPSRNPISD